MLMLKKLDENTSANQIKTNAEQSHRKEIIMRIERGEYFSLILSMSPKFCVIL